MKCNGTTRLHAAVILALTASAAAPVASAQDEKAIVKGAGVVEEVIVTAQKREENLQTVAASAGTLHRS